MQMKLFPSDSITATTAVHSYSESLHSCCSSWGHSYYTVSPQLPFGTGTVRSTHRTLRPTQYHRRRTHKVDSPVSFAAPACDNHDDKCHRNGLPHVPKKTKKWCFSHITEDGTCFQNTLKIFKKTFGSGWFWAILTLSRAITSGGSRKHYLLSADQDCAWDTSQASTPGEVHVL